MIQLDNNVRDSLSIVSELCIPPKPINIHMDNVHYN